MRRNALALFVALALVAAPAVAVIVANGDGTVPTGAPTPDPGLHHVAVVTGLSGVYLGDGWILTARHVLTAARNQKKTDVVLGGEPYVLLPQTEKPLSGAAGKPDLALVRIEGGPEMSPPRIARTPPTAGAEAILAGNGPLREKRRTCWNAAGAETPATTTGARCGFRWRKKEKPEDPPVNALRWGTSRALPVDGLLPGPQGTRTVVFGMVFRDPAAGGTGYDAQAGVGDSGGPVFVKGPEGFELAGLMLGTSSQIERAAVFGDRTYAADLSAYREEILRGIGAE